MIAPARPGTLIRSSKQGFDFGSGEKVNQGAGEALAGNGEHPLDLCGMRWCFEGGVAKEGVNRGEAQIATANA